MNSLRERASDLHSRRHRANRRSIAEPLGHRNEVGHDAPVLESPVVISGAAETRLHLVRDTEPAIFANDRVYLLQVVRRSIRHAADALHGLGEKGRDLAGGGETNHVADVRCGLRRDLFRRTSERTAIRVGIDRVMYVSVAANRVLPRAVRRQSQCARAVPVVRVAQRDHVAVPGVETRHLDREIVRFAARIREVRDVETRRHLRRELLGQQRKVRMQVDRGGVLQRAHLLCHAPHELRMAVANAHGHDARQAVEVSAARLVVEVLHVPLDDEQRLAVDRVHGGIRVLLPYRDQLRLRRAVVRTRGVIDVWQLELRCDGGHRDSGVVSCVALPQRTQRRLPPST